MRALTAVLLVLLAGAGAGTARGASLFDPVLRFRVISTEHFIIYFHRGEERTAQRLASIAEETWRALRQPLGVTPPRRTHVVLADQSEFANGFATPVPYDTIVIYTVWPTGSEFNFDDWLRLSFTHEFTHIVHLDRSEGWARVARNIFGRTSIVFPNLYLPSWQLEGIATYEESAITGKGRLHAGDFRAIVGEAARTRRFEPLDRVNGGVTDWPSGAGAYAYGARFHDYLATRFGADSFAALAAGTARRFPYTSTRAFLYVYGESLGDLWRDYEAATTSPAASLNAAGNGVRQLTHDGFSAVAPRFDRFTCAGCAADILYAAANPEGFPSLNRIAVSGAAQQRVATRFFGTTTAIGRDTIYFDQLEARRNVGLYSDLYALSRVDGRVRQLTSDERLRDPDVSADGARIVATRAHAEHRDLVIVRLTTDAARSVASDPKSRSHTDALAGGSADRSTAAHSQTSGPGHGSTRTTIETLISEPDVYFDAPRWSPDGRSVAVERHRLGALPEIVIVDVATRAVRPVAGNARTRFAMPSWRPDGTALVAAAAPGDETFNLVEIAADGSTCRQLTHVNGAALWPDVSPDGTTIAFAGYTTDGYDIFVMPYPEASESSSEPGHACVTPDNNPSVDASPNLTTRAYNPLTTLAPTSWFPVIRGDADQIRLGAAFGGVDVLGYHRYAADATWLVAGPADVPIPNRAEPDWSASYAYDRWRPTLYAAASATTSFFAGPPIADGTPTSATRRERTIETGVVLPFLHARVSHSALAAVLRSSREDTRTADTITRDRTAFRAGWQTATAHTYGYSVSPEGGVLAGIAAEAARGDTGSSSDATTVTADGRAYLPGLAPHHVIAVRLSGGVSSGDLSVGRVFLLGGGASAPGAVSFDSRASSLLRGFGDATFAGSRVALANAEYRWPMGRPQRGVGTWPFLLHTVHAAVFVDAGETWTRSFQADAMKISAGAELSSDVVLGYFARVTVTGGASWGHDGAHLVGDRITAFVRIGKAF
jgi:surface antigen Omp85-like protein/WD40 repeat protein